ncbi:hypothetical protein [Moraxella lacunata]|uniref:Transmembrane protein n=1 Tax=Moraxella lacunata TaxID=477 RepID=A0A1V4H0B3_MORLA|nr:hypothetical protein [Moraxella lacunata]OPH38307.1 hypothetical protein B5J94_04010 [Moraxella lacunata]
MTRDTLRTLHKFTAIIATLLIGTFWTSTLISEIFLSEEAVIWVKNAIAYGVFLLMLAMAMTGVSGMKMGAKSKHPKILAKKKRMPMIAVNGLLILLPCAFYLCHKASAGEFDTVFYAVQGVELLAGTVNLRLMFLSMKDGFGIRKSK